MKKISIFFAALVAVLFSVTETCAQITPPYYNPANVRITGGTINGASVGATTRSSGAFSSLAVGTVSASAGYLQVGAGSGASAGLIAGYLGVSGFGGIWSTGVTPSTSNYGFASSGATSYINATGVAGISINGAAVLQADSTVIAHLLNVSYTKTITAPGTTGAQTINKTTGRVNFAAAATSLVVTNSLATANSICHVTKATNDATMRLGACVAAAGSITIYADVAPAAETAVNFTVTN